MRQLTTESLKALALAVTQVEQEHDFIVGVYITDTNNNMTFEFDGEKFIEDASLVIYKRSRDETNTIP